MIVIPPQAISLHSSDKTCTLHSGVLGRVHSLMNSAIWSFLSVSVAVCNLPSVSDSPMFMH